MYRHKIPRYIYISTKPDRCGGFISNNNTICIDIEKLAVGVEFTCESLTYSCKNHLSARKRGALRKFLMLGAISGGEEASSCT